MNKPKYGTEIVVILILILGVGLIILYQPNQEIKHTQSPKQRIGTWNMFFYNNTITFNNITISYGPGYENSTSMQPTMDGANSYQIYAIPKSPYDLQVGDIIYFYPEDKSWGDGRPVLHRIYSIGNDSEGIWYITKGDNVEESDGIKIRFNQIKYVVIGIIY